MLCVDEKPQIQALEGGSATFPMQPGQEERTGHTYIRHGTTTLIAALDAKVGTVIGRCYARHRTVEFLAFLEEVELAIEAFIAQNNDHPQPFVWKRSAEDILDSIRRFCLPYLRTAIPQDSSESIH